MEKPINIFLVPNFHDLNILESIENNENNDTIENSKLNQNFIIRNKKIDGFDITKEDLGQFYENNNEDTENNENFDLLKSQIFSKIQNKPNEEALLFKDIQYDGISLNLEDCIDLISLFKNSELCQKTEELYKTSDLFQEKIYAKELSQLNEELEYAKNYMDEHDLPYFPPVNEKPEDFEPDIHKACKDGKLESVQYLIEHMNEDKNKLNRKGEAPIHIACQYCHLPIIRYLIDIQGVDKEFPNERGTTPFSYFCSSEVEANKLPIVSYFINKLKVNFNTINQAGNNPLIFACYYSNIDIVTYLIENLNCDINIVNNNGEDIVLASCGGNFNLLKYVLSKKKTDLTTLVSKTGKRPIHMAAMSKNDKNVIKYFIEDLNLDKNTVDENGYSALQFACIGGNIDIVKYLIEEQNFDINQLDNDGESPIFRAIANGHLPIVKYLLGLPNIDKTIRNKDGLNMLHKACFNGELKIIKYLIEIEKMDINDKDNSNYTIFLNACRCNESSKELFQYLYHLNPYFLDEVPDSGYSPLYVACGCGCLDGVKYLIEDCHLDVSKDPLNKYNVGPPEIAALRGNIEILKYFFEEHIVQKDFVGNMGRTLLQCACYVNNMKSIKWLVEEANVDINQIGNGQTALDIAIFKECEETIKYLRSKGAMTRDEIRY